MAMSAALAFVPMTEDEVAAEKRRRGYWLRLARMHAGENGGEMNQNEVAERLGLSEKSGSTISNWERGKGGGPSAVQLLALARLYGVPPSWFLDPPPTDEERLLAEIGVDAAVAALEDLDQEAGEPTPSTDGPPGERPRIP